MIRIIFFGEDVFSLTVIKAILAKRDKYQICCIVVLNPVSKSGKKLIRFASDHNITVHLISKFSKNLIEELNNYRFDFLVSCHFQKIIPPGLFRNANIASINLHPSLLPKYRGLTPHHWPFLNGDDFTAISVHLMDDDIDNGELVVQEKIELKPCMYISDLQRVFLQRYPKVMMKALSILTANPKDTYRQIGIPSYQRRAKVSDADISADDDVTTALRKIRAFSSPYWGCKFNEIIILKAEIYEQNTPIEPHVQDKLKREGLAKLNLGYLVQLTDGCLLVTKWKDTQ